MLASSPYSVFASKVGMSGKTYEKARAVVDAAKKKPERF
jgi:hypothetical protein